MVWKTTLRGVFLSHVPQSQISYIMVLIAVYLQLVQMVQFHWRRSSIGVMLATLPLHQLRLIRGPLAHLLSWFNRGRERLADKGHKSESGRLHLCCSYGIVCLV
jgi:hypothetical protein